MCPRHYATHARGNDLVRWVSAWRSAVPTRRRRGSPAHPAGGVKQIIVMWSRVQRDRRRYTFNTSSTSRGTCLLSVHVCVLIDEPYYYHVVSATARYGVEAGPERSGVTVGVRCIESHVSKQFAARRLHQETVGWLLVSAAVYPQPTDLTVLVVLYAFGSHFRKTAIKFRIGRTYPLDAMC